MTLPQLEAIPTQIRRIHVIMNPVSGLNPAPPEALEALLLKSGLHYQLHVTAKDGDAMAFAQAAIAAGADVVAAYGGDGTVMEVAHGLMDSSVPLAILPAGTANVMSVELGIPQTLEAALTLAFGNNAAVRAVDMGRVNEDRYFMLRVGIGLEADMTQKAEREEKKRWGKLAYIIATLRAIRDSRSARYKITIDGKRYRARGVSCVICNSGNVGLPNMSLAPEISPSDGLLDVIIFRGTDPGTIFSLFRSAFSTVFQHLRRVGQRSPIGRGVRSP